MGNRRYPRSDLQALLVIQQRLLAIPDGVPEIAAAELDASVVRGAIERYGCLLVRGLSSKRRIAAFPGHIDRVLDIANQNTLSPQSHDTRSWYTPLATYPGGPPAGDEARRKERIEKGAFWTADSPRLFSELCDLISETGVGDLIRSYFGERPTIGYNKCNLRRMRGKGYWSWHQDGAFLGAEVRSLNMWMALTDCGVDAPSLDVVPRRVDYIVETGTDGAEFSWSLAPDMVVEAARGTPVMRPIFEPGDALLFDHFFLHRAGGHAQMPKARYAIECWFFAPSAYPHQDQLPLVV